MITVDYFSDVLCVWAYGGQVRLDELQRQFGGRIFVRKRFMSLFADTATRIGSGWKDRGGFEGFGEHMQEVCAQWDHARLHDAVWRDCRPASSASAHAFLRAVALALDLRDDVCQTGERRRFDGLVQRVRCAFFEEGADIAHIDVLEGLLTSDDPPLDAIRARLVSGEAAAALHRDLELASSFGVRGSPTYVFNDGRQMLYGNVGYRIIQSNVQELLAIPVAEGEPSWC